MAPLYKIIAKNQPRVWGQEQEAAFKKVKVCLLPQILGTLWPCMIKRFCTLSCGALPYGIWAVLSHSTCDEEKSNVYVSRNLAVSCWTYLLTAGHLDSNYCVWGEEMSSRQFTLKTPTVSTECWQTCPVNVLWQVTTLGCNAQCIQVCHWVLPWREDSHAMLKC